MSRLTLTGLTLLVLAFGIIALGLFTRLPLGFAVIGNVLAAGCVLGGLYLLQRGRRLRESDDLPAEFHPATTRETPVYNLAHRRQKMAKAAIHSGQGYRIDDMQRRHF